ncbi:hypothetical protein AVEN_218282-1 [Araneus ventricosus]|uniref:Uncharacterized protein n=1 Tax=Araneus ventricosus TaxID=182803 RepID=A0A4Y2IR32_ARAVE|nr:hypothetical protein AVEN_218282-1 [Araneus ventricosus]
MPPNAMGVKTLLRLCSLLKQNMTMRLKNIVFLGVPFTIVHGEVLCHIFPSVHIFFKCEGIHYPEVPYCLISFLAVPPLEFLLSPSFPRVWARELSMRICCRYVCFLLLMDSNIHPRVGRAWRSLRPVLHFGPWCINPPLFQPFGGALKGIKRQWSNSGALR